MAVYGVKLSCKQRFYSLRCEPGEGQAAWAKALVLGVVGHLEVTGLRAEEAGLPQHLRVSLQVLTIG